MSTSKVKAVRLFSITPPPPPPPPPQSASEVLIPGLSNDIALTCLARVPRWHHPVLSAVSKPIRSLLSSPQFFTARDQLDCREHLLYISVPSRQPNEPPNWFAVHRKPNLNAVGDGDGNDSNLVLAPTPPCPSKLSWSAYAVLGPKIYVIGGRDEDVLCSSDVWVLDCRTHTWERGPSLRQPRSPARAVVFDGEIYVMGGREWAQDPKVRAGQLAEVFDPAIGRWEALPGPSKSDICSWITGSVVVGDRIFVFWDLGGIVFDPRANTWGELHSELKRHWLYGTCVVDGVLYRCETCGTILGFDEAIGKWEELEGVIGELPGFAYAARMASVRGKMVLLWDINEDVELDPDEEDEMEMDIWCAEIEVNRTADGDLLGRVKWVNELLSLHWSTCALDCISVSL